MKIQTRSFIALIALALVACGGPDAPSSHAPEISSFSATPSEISVGESTVLSWVVVGATELVVTPGAIDVLGLSDLTLSPERSVVYTLSARNASGTTQRSVTVTVDAKPPVGQTPLDARFDLADAVGLQLGRVSNLGPFSGAATSVSESGLLKVLGSGQLVDPLIEGDLQVQDFFVRNGRIYLLIQEYKASGEASECVLAEVDKDGTLSCVDSELRSIDVRSIQFDAYGGVYYRGSKADGSSVIRRSRGGLAVDYYVARDAISVEDFRVSREGLVLLQGCSSGAIGGQCWIRSVDEAAHINIFPYGQLLEYLPDGSLLVGHGDTLNRFLFDEGVAIDHRPYCASSYYGSARFDADWCYAAEEAFSSGRLYRSSNAVIALTGMGLFRFYPAVEQIAIDIDTITNGYVYLNTAVVAGYSDGEPRAYIVDVESGHTTDMLGAARIDVLRVLVQLSRERVLLYGLDLNRNQPVLAEYDLRHEILNTADVASELAPSFEMLDWEIGHVPPEPIAPVIETSFVIDSLEGWDEGGIILDASSIPSLPWIDQGIWDFGDGTRVEFDMSADSSLLLTKHYYLEPGEYTISLGVTNFMGSESTQTQEIVVPQVLRLASVHAGHRNSFAITEAGKVYAWGANEYGQLGDGTQVQRAKPVPVDFPEGVRVRAVSSSWSHTLGITETGDIYAWGNNEDGELGTGDKLRSVTPVYIPLPEGETAISVAAGGSFSVALTSTGGVYTWGGRWNGALGHGDYQEHLTPTRVAGLPESVVAVSAGSYVLAVAESGRLYGWGAVPGVGAEDYPNTPALITLPDGASVVNAAVGGEHALVLTAEGHVFAWGDNDYGPGQIGDGTTHDRPSPVMTLLPDGVTVSSVHAGSYSSFAHTADGGVYGWGRGSIGEGESTSGLVPAAITLPEGVTFSQVSIGGEHVLALSVSGELYTWGGNGHGQLGIGGTSYWVVPLPMQVR